MVELLIASAVLIIVLMTIFSSLEEVSEAQAFQADRSQSVNDMRGVLNRMTRDLRQATSVDEAASTASTITFSTPINGVSTQIVYTITGNTLTRKVGTRDAFTVLRRLASTNLFTYTSADTVSGVQWVSINLEMNPARAPDTTLILDSQVNLRNRTSTLTGI